MPMAKSAVAQKPNKSLYMENILIYEVPPQLFGEIWQKYNHASPFWRKLGKYYSHVCPTFGSCWFCLPNLKFLGTSLQQKGHLISSVQQCWDKLETAFCLDGIVLTFQMLSRGKFAFSFSPGPWVNLIKVHSCLYFLMFNQVPF